MVFLWSKYEALKVVGGLPVMVLVRGRVGPCKWERNYFWAGGSPREYRWHAEMGGYPVFCKSLLKCLDDALEKHMAERETVGGAAYEPYISAQHFPTKEYLTIGYRVQQLAIAALQMVGIGVLHIIGLVSGRRR